jgi:predicted class III extradiol MEMO1 family dioxygenase
LIAPHAGYAYSGPIAASAYCALGHAARGVDDSTAWAILNCSTELDGEQACGCVGINGLMRLARERALEVRLLDLRNSADTAGEGSRVVGYGAFALYPAGGVAP